MSCLAMVIFLGLKNHVRIQKTGYQGMVTGQFWVAYSIAWLNIGVLASAAYETQALEMQTFFVCVWLSCGLWTDICNLRNNF